MFYWVVLARLVAKFLFLIHSIRPVGQARFSVFEALLGNNLKNRTCYMGNIRENFLSNTCCSA